MKIEIVENGTYIEQNMVIDNFDLMDSLEYLQTEFRPLIFNSKVIKYFGIDLLWLLTKYR